MIGMHTFGASAPLKDVQKKFGFTPEAIVEVSRSQLELHGRVGGRSAG
jgi:transketolase